MKIKKYLQKYASEIVIILIGSFFGIYLMFSTFQKSENILYISSKVWSDFASHIPLIRSFSIGLNFPPEYPLFAGPVIKYHFGFYMGVGFLERIGLPIDLALNIPSAIGFILLTFIIYLFAKIIFKSKIVGILSVIFFIFNSSLSFIYYFQNNPISIKSILAIPGINNFQSFAPYGDGIISAFWNLNIYTNQRHLPLSFAFSLVLILIFLLPIFKNTKVNYKISVILGIILGLSFFLHLAVLFMSFIIIFFMGLLFSKLRKSAFVILAFASIIALPQYLFISSSGESSFMINIGYLVANNLTVYSFSQFWIYNLGVSLILIPLGFIFSNKKQRKILLSFFPLFLIGNIIQFSPEIAANHKFFNFFLLIGNMYSAYALVILWHKKDYLKPIVILALFFMIFGGILDFFPILNDKKVSIPDKELNPHSEWIINNTNSDSTFLNTSFLYNPASLSGRNIFFGWPYFAWSQGYDTKKRSTIYFNILESENKYETCSMLKTNNINFVEINLDDEKNPDLPKISNMWKENFTSIYKNNDGNYNIYSVNQICNQDIR